MNSIKIEDDKEENKSIRMAIWHVKNDEKELALICLESVVIYQRERAEAKDKKDRLF